MRQVRLQDMGNGKLQMGVWGSDVDTEVTTGTYTHVDTDADTYMKINL